MSRTFKLVVIVTVALFLVILAAGTTRASEEPQIVRVLMKEYVVQASQFVVATDRPVKFVVVNADAFPHQFVLQPMSRAESAPTDDAPVIGAGTLRTIQMLLSPGIYRIECGIKDHVERGMFSAIAAETTPRVTFSLPPLTWLPLLIFVFGATYIIADSAGVRITRRS